MTGEAVALELRPAKLPSRVLAVLLDLAVAMTVYILVTIGLVTATSGLDDAAQTRAVDHDLRAPARGRSDRGGDAQPWSFARQAGMRTPGGAGRRGADQVPARVGPGCGRCDRDLMTFGSSPASPRSCPRGAGASVTCSRARWWCGERCRRDARASCPRRPVAGRTVLPAGPLGGAGRAVAGDQAVPDRLQQLDPQVGRSVAERLASDLTAYTGTPAPHGIPAGRIWRRSCRSGRPGRRAARSEVRRRAGIRRPRSSAAGIRRRSSGPPPLPRPKRRPGRHPQPRGAPGLRRTPPATTGSGHRDRRSRRPPRARALGSRTRGTGSPRWCVPSRRSTAARDSRPRVAGGRDRSRGRVFVCPARPLTCPGPRRPSSRPPRRPSRHMTRTAATRGVPARCRAPRAPRRRRCGRCAAPPCPGL